MGTFRIKAAIARPDRPEVQNEIELLVDTGATHTWIPVGALEALGVSPSRSQSVRLADGRVIERGFAWIPLTLNGRTEPSPCLADDAGTEPLLGAVALEIFSLATDPVNRRLVPVTPPMASASPRRFHSARGRGFPILQRAWAHGTYSP